MNKSDFFYNLPKELIAQHPCEKRDNSSLMHLNRKTGEIRHLKFFDLPDLLNEGDTIILNDTKVIPARLYGTKIPTGAVVEFLLLEQQPDGSWVCLAGPGKKAKTGDRFSFGEGVMTCEVKGVRDDGNRVISFEYDGNFYEILDKIGNMPLPPYITEKLKDNSRYQTIYAKHLGSAAAPTAGLHFTERVLKAIDEKGIERNEVTLHVGAGTFKPVKSEEIAGHTMHAEWIAVKRESIERLIAHGGWCIAVGTTSVRTLESLYYVGVMIHQNPNATADDLHVPQWMPYEYAASEGDKLTALEALQEIADWMDRNALPVLHTSTQIIIAPGYDYHIVRTIVTNFHQPKSTLLLLVSAFVKGDWHRIYDYALANNFRFLSYGDSSLLNY